MKEHCHFIQIHFSINKTRKMSLAFKDTEKTPITIRSAKEGALLSVYQLCFFEHSLENRKTLDNIY